MTNTKIEEWKTVIGYEGLYDISNKGRLRRGTIQSNIRKSKSIIKSRVDPHGYLCVDLWKNNKCKRSRVHRLIMIHFVGFPEKGEECRHLDGNKLNNSLSNLKYGTRSENLLDDYKHNPSRRFRGVSKRNGERHYLSLLNDSQVKEIRSIGKFRGHLKVLSKKFKVSICTINRVINNKTYRVEEL